MWPAVPMIMSAAAGSCSERGELRRERGLVAILEEAQIEPQALVGQARDHRARQGAQCGAKTRKTGAPSLDGTDRESVAGQVLDGKRTAAGLTQHRRLADLVSVAERPLQERLQAGPPGPPLPARSRGQPPRR